MSFLLGWASGLYRFGADSEECWEETPLEGVFELELGFEVRSVSIIGGLGDLEGLECLDMALGDLQDGKEDSEVLRAPPPAPMLPLESLVAVVPDVPVVPLVVGRCMADREIWSSLILYIGVVYEEAIIADLPSGH